ncbi:MAG: hypothetical protein L6Q60_11210 [Rhodocyclaceae bacterium]|jgi:hypothetical protein|nr:hypothetical protein [Rhodocyclaceae bacterium]
MFQRNLLLVTLCLALAGPALAASGGHEHGHGTPATLQLDAGKKWPTDAALRASMAEIRENMAAALHDIHEKRLPAKGYAALAGKVEQSVSRIVAECKLDARADEQLHIVVAELLAGAERMAGKVKGASRQAGAVRVIGALDKYAAYFDDPGFKPIAH